MPNKAPKSDGFAAAWLGRYVSPNYRGYVMRLMFLFFYVVIGLFMIPTTGVAGEPFFCEKHTDEIFPKAITCLGQEYYVSHKAIGLATALLLEHRCGSDPNAEGYEVCQSELLREVAAMYEKMAYDPKW